MRRWIKFIIRLILVTIVFVGFYQYGKFFPSELILSPQEYAVPEKSVRFLGDYTFTNEKGERHVEQSIWNEIFKSIDDAHQFIILDMFLFNDFQGTNPENTRALSRELTEALIKKKTEEQHIAVALITDPINTVYGGATSTQLEQLKNAGILVITTDLSRLPDSNRAWGAFWRPFVSLWGNSPMEGWLPHPFQADGRRVSLRSWLSMLNFKANHRKILIADHLMKNNGGKEVQKMRTIITSSNPHDGSSAHSNVALIIDDGVWKDALDAEQKVASFSNSGLPSYGNTDVVDDIGPLKVTLLREEQIRKKTLSILEKAKKGDSIDIAMFYLSDRKIVRSLAEAVNRGTEVRLVLDPNKDAFGHKKNGIPNRPVAKELLIRTSENINIRWCDTHGEQCHQKLMMGKVGESAFILLGSANFTDRNIGGFNLEEDVYVESDHEFPAWMDAHKYFERIWFNKNGIFTTDYSTYEDRSLWKSTLYRISEFTGLSSF